MSSVAVAPRIAALDLIDVGENTRELDPSHVEALAASIALRGLIVPLVVRPDGERFTLVAGHHRYAACRSLGLTEVEVTLREQEGSSADSAAENVVRKQLSPLEEARAVKHMLDEGYTLDGAATVLGWSRNLVSARAKILELPEEAQRLLGTGELPVSAVAVLETINAVSPELCEAALVPVANGDLSGAQLASDPGWALGYALREGHTKSFAAYLSRLDSSPDRRAASRQEDRCRLRGGGGAPPADRPPRLRAARRPLRRRGGRPGARGGRADRVRARHADHHRQGAVPRAGKAGDRPHARGAARRQADRGERPRIARGLRARTSARRSSSSTSEHRAAVRELTAQAHGTNLDLGAALLQKLATVDPSDMDVARFFAYGLLGPDQRGYLGTGDHTVATIAANGIRLVFDEHRETTTPTLKSGEPGRTKVTYGEVEDAAAWLWKFVEGARSAG